MIDERMEKALNDQINAELYSSYMYLSMANYLAEEGIDGFSNWMKTQAQEELYHAMKIQDYLLERGGRARLQAIEQPPLEWDSALAVARDTYQHEQKVTGLINQLVSLADELNDYATRQFLQWFVEEQVEEEDSADNLVNQLEMAGDDMGVLLMLDRDYGSRPPLFQFPGGESD